MTQRKTRRTLTRTPGEGLGPQNRTTGAAIGIQIRSLGAIRPYAGPNSLLRGAGTDWDEVGGWQRFPPTYAQSTGKRCPRCKTGMTQAERDASPDVSVSVQRMYTPTDEDGTTYDPVYYRQEYGTRTRRHAKVCQACMTELQGRTHSYVSEKQVRRWLRLHGG